MPDVKEEIACAAVVMTMALNCSASSSVLASRSSCQPNNAAQRHALPPVFINNSCMYFHIFMKHCTAILQESQVYTIDYKGCNHRRTSSDRYRRGSRTCCGLLMSLLCRTAAAVLAQEQMAHFDGCLGEAKLESPCSPRSPRSPRSLQSLRSTYLSQLVVDRVK